MNKNYQLGNYVIYKNELWEVITIDNQNNRMRLCPRGGNQLEDCWVSMSQEDIIKSNIYQEYFDI